jgi:hypothetical protein
MNDEKQPAVAGPVEPTVRHHTPGPWKAASAAACAEVEVMEIAEVAHMRVIPAGGGWPTPGTPEVDAQLMAAAPELLAALDRLLASPDVRDAADAGALKQARAAIAKAVGQ